MAYCTVEELRRYKDVEGAGDDALLKDLIEEAQAAIDRATGRTFEASADTTRYFTVGVDAVGSRLLFDDDIAAITTVKTNADDGVGGTTVPSTAYVTLPRNKTPYYGIDLLTSSTYYWRYTSNPQAGIAVTGKWAFSLTAPAPIRRACRRWAAFAYVQKDAQVFDVVAIPDAGIIQVPQGVPADVVKDLMLYVRPRL